jgi:hypothetical protein
MSHLERLGLHQIIVLNLAAAPQRPASDVAAAAKYIAGMLDSQDATRFLQGLALDRAGDWQPDVQYSLVRNAQFHPVIGKDPIRIGFRAYQDGEAVIIHLIWYWPASGSVDTFARLWSCHWPVPQVAAPGYVGQGLLWTAGRSEARDDEQDSSNDSAEQLARATMRVCGQEPAHLTPLLLPGAALYTALHGPMRRHDWPTVLFFENAAIENSLAADRWVLDEWPMVVKYALLMEHIYLQDYRVKVLPELVSTCQQLTTALQATFATRDKPEKGKEEALSAATPMGMAFRGATPMVPDVLATTDPSAVEVALSRLGGPQHLLLTALGEGERLKREARRYLRNMEDHLQRLPVLDPNRDATAWASEKTVLSVTTRARHWADQIDAGVGEAHDLGERGANAIAVLNTQAQAVGATHERLLNEVIAVVGAGLGAAQLFDTDAARVLYGGLLILSDWPANQQPTEADLFLLRFLAVVLTSVLAWIIFRLILRLWYRFR